MDLCGLAPDYISVLLSPYSASRLLRSSHRLLLLFLVPIQNPKVTELFPFVPLFFFFFNVNQNQMQLMPSKRKKKEKRARNSNDSTRIHSYKNRFLFSLLFPGKGSCNQLTENKRASAEIDRDRGVDSHRQRGKIC